MTARQGQTGFVRDGRGSAAVEFAFGLMFLLVLLVGVAEFGRAMYQHHVIAKAVRDATRYLARVPDPSATTFQDVAESLALRGSTDTSAPYLLPDSSDAAETPVSVVFEVTTVDNSMDPPLYYGPETISVVRATATYAFQSALLAGFGLPGAITMQLTHVERHIGE